MSNEQSLKDIITDAANLVSEAIISAEAIRDTARMYYADYPSNPRRNHTDTRPYTLKDARHDASRAVNLLRLTWQILEPVDCVRTAPIDVSRLVNSPSICAALIAAGWTPPEKPTE
jgi:hypothetical protein